MLPRVEFTEKPERFELERRDGDVIVSLYDNIREETKDNDETAWYADVYYMRTRETPGLAERISKGFDKFLAKAKAEEQERQAREAAEASKLSVGDLTEIAVDQEFRICMLELGVEL